MKAGELKKLLAVADDDVDVAMEGEGGEVTSITFTFRGAETGERWDVRYEPELGTYYIQSKEHTWLDYRIDAGAAGALFELMTRERATE